MFKDKWILFVPKGEVLYNKYVYCDFCDEISLTTESYFAKNNNNFWICKKCFDKNKHK